jgi:hypothetical protein
MLAQVVPAECTGGLAEELDLIYINVRQRCGDDARFDEAQNALVLPFDYPAGDPACYRKHVRLFSGVLRTKQREIENLARPSVLQGPVDGCAPDLESLGDGGRPHGFAWRQPA